jgi:hypothetical protein
VPRIGNNLLTGHGAGLRAGGPGLFGKDVTGGLVLTRHAA